MLPTQCRDRQSRISVAGCLIVAGALAIALAGSKDEFVSALLIGLAVVGLFPVGPSLGAATAVLILGTNGVAASAAAGALLTVTAALGALCFATWLNPSEA